MGRHHDIGENTAQTSIKYAINMKISAYPRGGRVTSDHQNRTDRAVFGD